MCYYSGMGLVSYIRNWKDNRTKANIGTCAKAENMNKCKAGSNEEKNTNDRWHKVVALIAQLLPAPCD